MTDIADLLEENDWPKAVQAIDNATSAEIISSQVSSMLPHL